MAIALGATTSSSNTGASSLTFAGPTVTGSNTILWVAQYLYRFTAQAAPTYNGVAMTIAGSPLAVEATRLLALYYVVNPASAANVVISGTGTDGSRGIRGVAVYYTGAKQTGVPDATATEGPSGGSPTITDTIVTVADNSWVFGAAGSPAGAGVGVSTGVTSRANPGAGGADSLNAGDSNAAVTPAGNYSMTFTNNTDTIGMLMASFAPAVAGGPTTVKTFDGITQSSGIKTYLGQTVATTKSVIGAT